MIVSSSPACRLLFTIAAKCVVLLPGEVEEARPLFWDDVGKVAFVDPFRGMGRRGGTRRDSAGVAPDEVVEKT
jgi:hypothetical protein